MSKIKHTEEFEIFKEGMKIARKLSIEDNNLTVDNIQENVSIYGEDDDDPLEKDPTENHYLMGEGFYFLEAGEEHYNDVKEFPIFPSHEKFVQYQTFKGYDELTDYEKEIFSKFIDLHWKMKFVDQTGYDDDNAGYGTNVSRTFHFPTYDMYITFYGYYSSYGGMSYESCKQTFPIQKTITVYE